MSDLTGTSTKEQLAYNQFVQSQADGLSPIPVMQTNTIWSVIGVPPNTMGANGDIAIRQDGGVGTTIYQKRTGAWVATAA